mmetsp:Transcript_19589/g.52849  ORF Transcript_19589/g.52849 Transcript_19589/m.52849 type:complete len:207 (+) Transcript_19589:1185-1805(+)
MGRVHPPLLQLNAPGVQRPRQCSLGALPALPSSSPSQRITARRPWRASSQRRAYRPPRLRARATTRTHLTEVPRLPWAQAQVRRHRRRQPRPLPLCSRRLHLRTGPTCLQSISPLVTSIASCAHSAGAGWHRRTFSGATSQSQRCTNRTMRRPSPTGPKTQRRPRERARWTNTSNTSRQSAPRVSARRQAIRMAWIARPQGAPQTS